MDNYEMKEWIDSLPEEVTQADVCKLIVGICTCYADEPEEIIGFLASAMVYGTQFVVDLKNHNQPQMH